MCICVGYVDCAIRTTSLSTNNNSIFRERLTNRISRGIEWTVYDFDQVE